MSFPDRWLQIWWAQPNGASTRAATVFWFSLDAPWTANAITRAALDVDCGHWFTFNARNLFPYTPYSSGGPRGYIKATNGIFDVTPLLTISPIFVADPLPNRVCVNVRRLTATPGRSGRGRMALSNVSASWIDGNHLLPSAIVNLQNYADLLINTFVSSTVVFTPVLVSYKLGIMMPLTGHIVTPRLATCMRKTLGYHAFHPTTPKPPPP